MCAENEYPVSALQRRTCRSPNEGAGAHSIGKGTERSKSPAGSEVLVVQVIMKIANVEVSGQCDGFWPMRVNSVKL
jgi:hypothetical protein